MKKRRKESEYGKYGPVTIQNRESSENSNLPRHLRPNKSKKSLRRKVLEGIGLIGIGTAIIGSLWGCYEMGTKRAQGSENTIPAETDPKLKPVEKQVKTLLENEEKLEAGYPLHWKPATKSQGTIVLDAGHRNNKYDRGATYGSKNEHKESEYVLSQAKKVKEYLEAKGYNVHLTRNSEDKPVSLDKRLNFARKKKADVFVSLHYNSAKSNTAEGTETLYYTPEGKTLASYIQPRLVKAIKTKDRGIKYRKNVFVLKSGKIPSALVETVFINNDKDRKKASGYADEKAIAEGIHEYMEAKK